MSRFDKFLTNMYGLVNFGCLLGLAGIALKRNKDAYDNACGRLDAELKNIALEVENDSLKREREYLKKKYESKEVEEA